MIYLFITATITPARSVWGPIDTNDRKSRYDRCISATLQYIKERNLIKPVIIVNDPGMTKSFFDEYDCDVVYASTNNPRYHNKGVNELNAIKCAIAKYNVRDDDIIIKQTGRYCPCSSYFYNKVTSYCGKYDAFAKFYNVCRFEYEDNDCILGLVGLKCKYFRTFEYSHDHNGFDGDSPEVEFAKHIRNNVEPARVMALGELELELNFANSPDQSLFV